jgi:hypothetical protein
MLKNLGKGVNRAFAEIASEQSMTSEKTLRFQGKNWNLDVLSNQIQQQLQSDGYKTQVKSAPMGTIIQAQKAGILRDVITADRAFTIMVSGQPNDFTIHVGIGKWVQNIAVAAVETLLISVLFLAVDVPEMLWTTHVEKEIIRKISDIASKPTLQQAASM